MSTHRREIAALSLATAALVGLFACNTRSHAEPPAREESAQAEAAATAAPAPGTLVAAAPKEQPALRNVGPMPSLAPLVEAVKGAVVNVEVKANVRARFGDDHPMSRFFGFGGRQPPVRQGSGSGFVIDPSGRVLTNNHVVEEAMEIEVKFDDGSTYKAKVLGRDPLTDVALLELQGVKEPLPSVKLGDSDAMKVGDYVVAIGNPFGLESSVSAGILSARARTLAGPYDDFLQTDAAINPGNSGGPLFNLRGEVIGINTAIINGGPGIGFAVPSNMARDLLPQLESGEVHRGFLGVQIQDLSKDLAQGLNVPVTEGAVIVDTTDGMPAAKAGVRRDDVVVAVDGKPVSSNRELTRMIGAKRPGSTATLTLYRGGQKQDVKVKLAERPDLENRMGRNAAPGPAQERSEKLGLSVADPDEGASGRGRQEVGAVVVEVTPGSRADDAGLSEGMLIVEAGGKPVRSASDFQRILSQAPSGKSLLLRVVVGSNRLLRALPIP